MNEALLNAVELLILASQPMLGKWMDPAAIAYNRRLDEITNRLKSLRLEAKALDLLVVVPGV